MAKKSPSLVPDFGSFDPIQAANFFYKNLARQSLDVMVSYHHVQYQRKLMIQS